ncbi:MAG: hypothetical protein KDC38_05815, partial [Planctomycetes bacterium]|nr:hypothetical protein [Planctomycetota bacterium]
GFVALGTVADVVPLIGENRILVHYGLRSFAMTEHVGVRTLLEESRVRADAVLAETIAFRIAPLINAAGRLGSPDRALDLLLSRDDEESRRLASWLGQANQERKAIENEMFEAGVEQIEATGGVVLGRPIVVAREGWHSGVAGIVASRLVERFRCPAFVIAVNDGLGRGSARSLEGIPLEPFYEAARAHAESIGGHALAGGLAVLPDRIDDLAGAIQAAAPPASRVDAASRYDLELTLGDIQPPLLQDLRQLEPHGQANPTPCFRFRELRIEGDVRRIGKNEDHLTFLARQGRRRIRVIYFRGAERARELTRIRNRFSVVAEIYLNDFRGNPRPELRLIDFGAD